MYNWEIGDKCNKDAVLKVNLPAGGCARSGGSDQHDQSAKCIWYEGIYYKVSFGGHEIWLSGTDNWNSQTGYKKYIGKGNNEYFMHHA